MKGEQLQNFVEHLFSRPAPPISTNGGNCSGNTPDSNPPAPPSTGCATDSESAVYSRWARRAWQRQGRIEGAPCSGTANEEDESDDTSDLSSPERERKQKKLWAYRQRTMRWANPLTWTRPAFRRRLNANFVDCLMNWPPSWTSARTACGPAEMALWLSRARQQLYCLTGEPEECSEP